MKLKGRNLMFGMQGDDVKLLQTELNQLGWKIKVDGDFGRQTQTAVYAFELWKKLPRTGIVNQTLVTLLNKAVEFLKKKKFKIFGLVIDSETKQGLKNLSVEAWDKDLFVDDKIQVELTREDGTFLMTFEETKFRELLFDKKPDLYFKIYKDDLLIKDTNDNVLKNIKPGDTEITIEITGQVVESDTFQQIKGRIILENGMPAENINLRLYRREFGDKAEMLSETITSEQGFYTLPYKLSSTLASLEIRAVDINGNEIPLSKPLNYLKQNGKQIVNLGAPNSLQIITPEYQRLVIDLKLHIGELENLADLKENAQRQDITVLNRASGWDARLIALAVKSAQLSIDTDVPLPQEALYGLLRAGLPSDKLTLARVGADVAEQAWKTVRDAGIIDMDDEQINEFKQQFNLFSNQVRLNLTAPGSQSTYSQILETSGLETDAKTIFTDLYLNHQGDAAQFWDKLRNINGQDASNNPVFTEEQIFKLQLQGKLAFLSSCSEKMTVKLMQKKISDPVQLVDHDFHQADTWSKEIFNAADIPEDRYGKLTDTDKKNLEAIIPIAYSGENIENRLNAYAEDMARKVRLSYPTHVVGRLIEQDNTDKFKLGTDSSNTANLLKNAANQGFRLGRTPAINFFKTHIGVAADIDENEFQSAQEQIKKLHRIYQITPCNKAMPVLLSLGITSAYDVMAYTKEMFVKIYHTEYINLYGSTPAKVETELIYRKASQASSITYNLFTTANKMESDLTVAGMSAPIDVQERARNELIKQFPTMESLFGSMDYCECEHCRSVLSPAAYFVDLLQFIEVENEMWANDHKQEYTENYMKPYDALVERRPDLPQIKLTCANTHTSLPYIDIVNEILEYFVAKGILEEDAAQNTGEATTEELLAEPQNVIREAYDKLNNSVYPLKLPFDLWIETVRQFSNYFEIQLTDILNVFCPGDELFAPSQSHDRFSIFMESLGLSFAEVAIFIDPDPLSNNKWYHLYGFPTIKPSIQNQTNDNNATVTITNDAAAKFKVGDICTYFSTSNEALSEETKIISTIGLPDTGCAEQTIITLKGKWNLPPEEGDLLIYNAIEKLKSAKTLSRLLDVSYKEIVKIIQTGFVNPNLEQLAILYKLGVSVQDARFYLSNLGLLEQDSDNLSTKEQESRMEVEAFKNKLEALAEKFKIPVAKLEEDLQNIPFDKVILLADPDTGCNFDLTTLQYANGQSVSPIILLRINLFVRLWRKIGWTIEETDKTLCSFMPDTAAFDSDPDNLAKQPFKTALIYFSHLKALDKKVQVGKQSILKLLTLWSDIATTGKNSLYAQLFLNPSILKSGQVKIIENNKAQYLSVFDHPLGNYLTTEGLENISNQVIYEVSQLSVIDADKIDSNAFSEHPKISLTYHDLEKVQYLSYQGILTDSEKEALLTLSSSPVLPPLLKAVQLKAKEFSLAKSHLLALQGALELTSGEISQIFKDAGILIDKAKLSLKNISLLYRYKLLSKGLNLSIYELIALKQLSDLDPFKSLHPDPLITIDNDFFLTQTLRFVEVANEVNSSGLKIEDLEYLLRHRFDKTGKYQQNNESILVLLKTLSEGILNIRMEHPLPINPGTMSDEVLQQKLGLILPSEIVSRFVAMLNGTVEFTVKKSDIPEAGKLNPEYFIDELSIINVSYNPTRQEQKLTFRGVLFDIQKANIENRLRANLTDAHLTDAQLVLFVELLNMIQNTAKEFFEKHLQKQLPSVIPDTGFLEEADYELLFDKDLSLEAGETEQDRLINRRANITKAFIPFLQERLIRQFIIQTMTAFTGAELELMESLITDKRLLTNPDTPLDALSNVSERGISASFFSSIDCSGSSLKTISLSDANTELKDDDGNMIKPVGSNSACFEGYLKVPDAGAYRFYVVLSTQNAKTELHFDHLTNSVLTGTASADGEEIGNGTDEYIELKPGIAYRFCLNLCNLNGGDAKMMVQGETLPKDKLSQLVLYPYNTIKNAESSILLLTKVLQLMESLDLDNREIRFLLTEGATAFDNLNLSKLAFRDANEELELIAIRKKNDDDSLTKDQALQLAIGENPILVTETEQVPIMFNQFLRLAKYAQLKRDLAGKTNDLITVFEANSIGNTDLVYECIANLSRRDESTIRATSDALFSTPDFNSEKPLQRLWEALQLIEQFGVPVTSLIKWIAIVNPNAMPEQRFDIACDLKDTIKAGFDSETWKQIAQPIFDKLRQYQRDSLVAYVMHLRSYTQIEQLYEYFLIDPGMEPVVQTSRIRLAIGSVQLFIQRCLLNLEKEVHPSGIMNSHQWDWIKRYRVWEANRKIFLFPENWLEPEFRDDKTHLFTELEGALLQGDVSRDLVEDAFFNYLKKLDELARLNIVAMHIEEDSNATYRTLHVIGRTFSLPYKYFYRRYVHRMWTPWEPVTAEIQGDHLAPIIWRDRLYLFWITFLDKPDEDGELGSNTSDETIDEANLSDLMSDVKNANRLKKIDMQLHWCEYFEGEWTTQESGGFSIWEPKTVLRSFDPKLIYIHVSKEYENGEENGVYIHIKGKINQTYYLAGRNSVPEKKEYRVNSPLGDMPRNPYNVFKVHATLHSHLSDSPTQLYALYNQKITNESSTESNNVRRSILQSDRGYTLLQANNNIMLGLDDNVILNTENPEAVKAVIKSGLPEITSLMKPVFYQDNTNTFFIEPNVIEQTIEDWQDWVTRTPQPNPDWKDPEWWKDIVVIPEKPREWQPCDPRDPRINPYDPSTLFTPQEKIDWLVNPVTGLLFEDVLIGPAGQTEIDILTTDVNNVIAEGSIQVNVNSGSSLASGTTLVLNGATTLEETGLSQALGGLNVVGSAGFNSTLSQNLNNINHLDTGIGMSGASQI